MITSSSNAPSNTHWLGNFRRSNTTATTTTKIVRQFKFSLSELLYLGTRQNFLNNTLGSSNQNLVGRCFFLWWSSSSSDTGDGMGVNGIGNTEERELRLGSPGIKPSVGYTILRSILSCKY